MCKHRSDLGYLGGKQILHRWSPSGAHGVKVWLKNSSDDGNNIKWGRLVKDRKATDFRLILCTKQTGYYLTVQGTPVTSTVLEATEFRDFCAHITILPPPPQL